MSLAAAPVVRSGRPLLFLYFLIAGWVGIRVAIGSLPFEMDDLPTRLAANEPVLQSEALRMEPSGQAGKAPRVERVGTVAASTPVIAPGREETLLAAATSGAFIFGQGPQRRSIGTSAGAIAVAHGLRSTPSHGPLRTTETSPVSNLPDGSRPFADRQPTLAPPGRPRPGIRLADRLSVESWLFIREGGASGAAVGTGASFASYGRSQAGAILRYRLAPGSRLDPAAYVRADGALAGEGERQGAVGLSFRPLAAWPLRAHVEARATRQGGRTDVRPAAFVTAGTDAVALPAGFAARAYAQAGYVGGRFSSAFADGRIVADREVTRFDLGALRLGGGIWGGAQRGAQRRDAGPSATLTVGMGALPANISLDYRFRLAGVAAPGSGAALTLSRSF